MLYFQSLRRRAARQSRRTCSRFDRGIHGSGRGPQFEPLEDRRLLAAGDLDLSFGDGGIVTTSLPGDPEIGAGEAIALQNDGKIVTVGFVRTSDHSDYDSVVARYNADGSLDSSFGNGGIVLTDIVGREGKTQDVAIDDQGRIVVAGGRDSAFVLARYNSNGTLDSSFGIGGLSINGSSNARGINAIKILSNGKIVAAGRHFIGGSGAPAGDFAVLQYNTDGSLDAGFGNSGMTVVDFGNDESVGGMTIDSSGRILVVGNMSIAGAPSQREMAFARFNADGSLDTTFNSDGKLTIDFVGANDRAEDVKTDFSGRIVIAGTASGPTGSSSYHTLLRLNDDGSFDADFDGDGVVQRLGSGFANLRSLELQDDGKIVAAGSDYSLFVGRWNADGSADSTWGNNGRVTTDITIPSPHAANDVVLQADGRVLVAGTNYNSDGDGAPDNIFGLARYLNDCDTPVSAWRADGDALDAEGRNDGQLLNGATFGPGQIGQAFELDGVDDAVQIFEDGSALDGFAELTLAAWINPDNFDPDSFPFGSTANAIVTKYDSTQVNGLSYSLFVSQDGTLALSVYDTFPSPDSFWRYTADLSSISAGSWTHVAAVWNGGSEFELYINGAQVAGTLETFGSPVGMANNDTPVNIGRFESVTGSFEGPVGFFDGFIDDVRIYSCGLDEGKIQEIYLEGDNQPVNVAGRVFDDANNDGSDSGDTGLAGLMITLTGADDNGPVNLTTTTMADGSYVFEEVLPGTYSITAEQPGGLLDGKETAGNSGGTVDNTQDSNTISGIVIGTDGVDATDYNFANILPSDLQGLVWEDFNNDGEVNFGEKAIENVSLTLTGTDDRGNAVTVPTTTDVDGVYMFVDLRPGDLTVTQTQPVGFDDGLDAIGTVNGSPVGDNSVNDVISSIALGLPASIGENYNFGERPEAGGGVTGGQTATIGFWQNNNGQALIESLNGGANSTQLSGWLSTTFANMYGDDGVGAVNANDLSGLTNAEVADFYSDLFRRKKKEAVQMGLGGPVKMDAQVMAVALSTYVTNQTLAGLTAESYGFLVTEDGVGTSTFNVGDAGEAFDVADNTDVAVLDLLFATDNHSLDGVLYDEDGDGDADDDWETTLRTLANDLYSAINEAGDI